MLLEPQIRWPAFSASDARVEGFFFRSEKKPSEGNAEQMQSILRGFFLGGFLVRVSDRGFFQSVSYQGVFRRVSDQ